MLAFVAVLGRHGGWRTWQVDMSSPLYSLMKRGTFKKPTYAEVKAACYPLTPTRKRMKQAARRLKTAPKKEEMQWARAVRERDDFTCQYGTCGYRDRSIHAHHIAPRSRRPDLKLVLSNGIALCPTHHRWCHDFPIQAEEMGLLSSESYEKGRRISLIKG